MTEKYWISRNIKLVELGGVKVHYVYYIIRGPRGFDFLFGIPCRSNLHRVLTGMYYNWKWDDDSAKEVSMEEAFALKAIYQNCQKEYKLFKDTLNKMNTEGLEEARKWFMNRIKVLVMSKL